MLELVVSVLFAIGFYFFMQRHFMHFLIGFLVISNAVNIFLVTRSGHPSGKTAPILIGSGDAIDPLPQALTLTAIVIGFGVLAFLVAVIFKHMSSKQSFYWGKDHE